MEPQPLEDQEKADMLLQLGEHSNLHTSLQSVPLKPFHCSVLSEQVSAYSYVLAQLILAMRNHAVLFDAVASHASQFDP